MKRNEKFKDLIFYEIYPTSFYDSNNDGIGDLEGIRQKLSYINELGCNAIWINPFFTSPFKDGGYDVSNFFDIDPKFGTMKDFNNLIKDANKFGIKIIIDCVAGHASEENEHFIKSGKEKTNECSDLFIWNNNVWSLENGYKLISGRHPRNGNYLVNFFSFQPAFNYGFNVIEHPEWQMSYKDKRTFKARDYIINVMKFWLHKGVFGFRVDMADSLVKNDNDKEATIKVWNYIFKEIRKDYPESFFVSEWSDPSKSFKAGFDCDFVLDHWDNFYHRLTRNVPGFSRGVALLNGGEIDFFMKDLKWRYEESIKNNGYLGIISGNHDTTRMANYLDLPRLKMFYLFMFTMPGIPFIYYGDEIQMKYKHLPNKDGGFQRVGSRTPMQWNHSLNDGFSKANEKNLYLPINKASRITLEDNLKDKNSLYYFIKNLIKIRKDYPSLTSKEMSFSEKDRILIFERKELKLILNCSNESIELNGKIIVSTGNDINLKPYEAALVEIKNND